MISVETIGWPSLSLASLALAAFAVFPAIDRSFPCYTVDDFQHREVADGWLVGGVMTKKRECVFIQLEAHSIDERTGVPIGEPLLVKSLERYRDGNERVTRATGPQEFGPLHIQNAREKSGVIKIFASHQTDYGTLVTSEFAAFPYERE